MVIEFVKMHGLGNDFIMLENIDTNKIDIEKLTQDLCKRNESIGADGLILICDSAIADTQMRIFNTDGSEAEMCGNGIRCFAKYVYERKIVTKTKFTVETLAGIMEPELQLFESGKVDMIRVNMSKPQFERASIPMTGPEGKVIEEKIDIDGEEVTITSMVMGVPHTIVFVENITNFDIETLGSKIETHKLFPRKTNVDFVEVVNSSSIKVRTWERGVGTTLACGTGSCASVVAGIVSGKVAGSVNVELELGNLFIEWEEGKDVFMTGPAVESFYGFINYNPLA